MESSIEEAAFLVTEGEVVAFPTETVYALAASPFSRQGISAVLDIKSRDVGPGLGLIASSREGVSKLYGRDELPEIVELLGDAFWPGPLTLILEPSPDIFGLLAPGVCAENGSIAVRYSSCSVAQKLAEKCGGLITATSANPKGLEPSRSAAKVREYFPEMFIIEKDNTSESELPSTYLDIRGNACSILREGAVSRAQLEKALEGSGFKLGS